MHLQAFRDLTQRIQTNLEADDRVIGLVMLGSAAETSRLPDEWSDHDFFVITHPGQQESMRQDLSWLPDYERIVLSIRETEHGLKVFYDTPHLLEFAVFDKDELAHVKANDYRFLINHDDLFIPNISQVLSKYDRDIEMVLAVIYVGAGRYARGEHLSAHVFIKHHLLHHLLPIFVQDMPDNLDPFRRIEAVAPEISAEINAALLLPTLDCARKLMDLMLRYTGYSGNIIEIVTNYLERVQIIDLRRSK